VWQRDHVREHSVIEVFKALELIEFADLIPPLEAELQGTPGLTLLQGVLVLHLPYQLIVFLFSVYREQAKNKKGSPGLLAAPLAARPQRGTRAAVARNAVKPKSA
jgi:hypothetical protein